MSKSGNVKHNTLSGGVVQPIFHSYSVILKTNEEEIAAEIPFLPPIHARLRWCGTLYHVLSVTWEDEPAPQGRLVLGVLIEESPKEEK